MNNDSEVMYRLLVQNVVDYAIYMLKPDGTVINWNSGAQRAKGYTAEEITGKNFSLFYSEQDQKENIPQRNLHIAAEQGYFETEGWRYRKDGSAFWAHVVIDAIRDDSNTLIGYAKITRDVTERREYEQQLLRSRNLAEVQCQQMSELSAFLDNIITNIPSCVIVEDAITREILLVNGRAEQLLGVSKTFLQYKRPHECLSPELSDYFNSLADIALRSEGVHEREHLLMTSNGQKILQTRTTTFSSKDMRQNYVMLIVDDVTDQRAADERIRHMAHHDNLTGLPNRVLFHQNLSEALRVGIQTGHQTATLCLDLDYFKHVNDTLGHQIGDELLSVVARRLRAALHNSDTLARIGGDEFAIVIPDIMQAENAGIVAQRLIESIRQPINIEGHNLSVGLSVGIVLSAVSSTPEYMLRCADMALYEAKRNGRSRYEYFTPAMEEIAHRRSIMESDLREAIARRQLELYYQPITQGDRKTIIGYEALMRWHHPVRGLIMPADFIPIAEETGLIYTLGAYALYEACREAVRWEGNQLVSVNLSPLQFKNSSLVSIVEGALNETGLAPSRLELEITESVLLEETLNNISTLQNLKAIGVQIALDDFGTGFSSLSYLRSFPFDKIKIDKSFISDMNSSRESLAIIRAITGMSRSLDIQIVAEGVENDEQFSQLREEGCTLFQGYLFGCPQPPEQRPPEQRLKKK